MALEAGLEGKMTLWLVKAGNGVGDSNTSSAKEMGKLRVGLGALVRVGQGVWYRVEIKIGKVVCRHPMRSSERRGEEFILGPAGTRGTEGSLTWA